MVQTDRVIGNLPSEIVNKRDIFQIFYKYGKLAQISIKQAYGFVQFLDPNACRAALENEQGMRIKDRNMRKNTRLLPYAPTDWLNTLQILRYPNLKRIRATLQPQQREII